MSPRSIGKNATPGPRYRPARISPSLRRHKPAPGERDRQRAQRKRSLSHFASMLVIIGLVIAWPVYGETLVSYLGPPPKVLEAEALVAEISTLAGQHPGTYGVYIKVLETGEEVVYNDAEFAAASCYKLPLALMTYKMAIDGKVDLDSKIAYTRDDWEAGTGVLQTTRPGTEFTIRKLVSLAVIESDNIAANMLLRKLGKHALVDFHKASGAKVIPDGENVSCPSDMGRFAEQVFDLARKQPEHGAELLGLFIDSRFKDRLPVRLPDDVEVANKIGTVPGVVNDVGIVIDDKVSYVIAVMSRDVGNTEKGAAAIADISLAVYNHISQRSEKKLRGEGIGRRLLDRMEG